VEFISVYVVPTKEGSLMKKLQTRFLSALIVLVLLSACGSSNASKWSDGSFEGSAKGLYGDVVMRVVIENGKITGVEVVSHSESAGITDAAFDQIPAAVIEKQGLEGVDTLAGATVSSEAIIEALATALKKAEK
jgi:uncharacterized protein with FMN-binding domain